MVTVCSQIITLFDFSLVVIISPNAQLCACQTINCIWLAGKKGNEKKEKSKGRHQCTSPQQIECQSLTASRLRNRSDSKNRFSCGGQLRIESYALGSSTSTSLFPSLPLSAIKMLLIIDQLLPRLPPLPLIRYQKKEEGRREKEWTFPWNRSFNFFPSFPTTNGTGHCPFLFL